MFAIRIRQGRNREETGLQDDEKSDIVSTGRFKEAHRLANVDTGGQRNEIPLTEAQIENAKIFAESLGMPIEKIRYSNSISTSYGAEFDVLVLGTDLYPVNNIKDIARSANADVSWKGAIGHEIVGHRDAAIKGWTQSIGYMEEAQASIRAARFTPEITQAERITLVKDALSRLPDDVKLNDIRDKLLINER